MLNKSIVVLLIAGLILAGTSCEKTIPGLPNGDEILDGPIDGLTPEQNRIFLNGDIAAYSGAS